MTGWAAERTMARLLPFKRSRSVGAPSSSRFSGALVSWSLGQSGGLRDRPLQRQAHQPARDERPLHRHLRAVGLVRFGDGAFRREVGVGPDAPARPPGGAVNVGQAQAGGLARLQNQERPVAAGVYPQLAPRERPRRKREGIALPRGIGGARPKRDAQQRREMLR